MSSIFFESQSFYYLLYIRYLTLIFTAYQASNLMHIVLILSLLQTYNQATGAHIEPSLQVHKMHEQNNA